MNEAKKPQFTYCKLEDLKQLETLLKSTGKFPSIIGKNGVIGQIGQKQTSNDIDPTLKDSSLNFGVAGPVGFEPRTFSLEGLGDVDLEVYREYLDKKYMRMTQLHK